ncbi:hypothetical protein C1646_774095 [Rhizophagus diaphanus]|nr:hypothetical protein C1646_774095 [Rhizophagus diaphanus] [Rhizophagus sp. MUCL 43196]
MKLDDISNNSPVLTALESSTKRIIPQKNHFGVAFSIAKTAINIALETGSDIELVKLLKDFILNKQRSRNSDGIESEIINVIVEKILGKSAIHDITSQTNIQQNNDDGITSRSQ